MYEFYVKEGIGKEGSCLIFCSLGFESLVIVVYFMLMEFENGGFILKIV